MSFYKGTLGFNSNQGGFSQSFYATNPNETQKTFMDKMQDVLNGRLLLSQCNPAIGVNNPILPEFIRVEDELIERDAFTQQQIPPANGWTGFTRVPPANLNVTAVQNLDLQLGPIVEIYGGAPRQEARQLFHGLPLAALNQQPPDPGQFPTAFLRNVKPNPQWIRALERFLGVLAAAQVGFRTITGAWNLANGDPGPFATPNSVNYNTMLQNVELQWVNAPPAWPLAPAMLAAQMPANYPAQSCRMRVQVRGWKGFQVLNGRWAAQVVQAQPGNAFALRIIRTCRAPLVANLPFVSPIAWTSWYPGQNVVTPTPPVITPDLIRQAYSITDIDAKKLGRNFDEPRGRQRNRPT